MSETQSLPEYYEGSGLYQIRLKGHLDDRWADRFDGLTIKLEENGDTLLSGPVPDQPALYGILRRVRDLGLPLVSVTMSTNNKNHSRIGEEIMNTSNKTNTMNRKMLLSTLWIFAVLNYLYCDVASLMDSSLLKQYLAGNVGGMEINEGFLLAAGILMEISISMVLISRITPYKVNRNLNILAGIITTLVQAATLIFSKPTMYYLFFSVIEISTTAAIIWLAWTWRDAEN